MATTIKIEIDENKLKELVRNHLSSILDFDLSQNDIQIMVRTKHNHRAEWETGNFKATVDKVLL